MSSVSVLNVFLYDRFIGTITNVGHDRTLFAFTEDYIDDPERPVLSMNFIDPFGGVKTDINSTQTKLTPFFSNVLPEGSLREYLAERAGVHSEREFFLLWVLGQDLPGALTVQSADGNDVPIDGTGPSLLPEQAKRDAMRFSLAGVQLKFSAVQQASGGLTIPATGVGGSWIIKLPSSRFEAVPENEFSVMELARQVGIDAPETRILDIEEIENIPQGVGRLGEHAFAIKRFDRNEYGERIHIEDFAQVFGEYPRNKYGAKSIRNIAEIIYREGQESDIEEFVRRLVFNNLIGNADMHIKNWSLIYMDPRIPSLAPAYDFVSTVVYIEEKEAALKVSRSKKFSDFTFDELSHLSAKARLPEKIVLDSAKEAVSAFHDVWNREKNNLLFSKWMVEKIDKHIKTIPMSGA